ncbi:MAG: dTDP-4-dehydrorhamnose reductase [Bacteroidales bacterium]|nr:dTDP-4-dehydrorhamnose reductase [Bacteroidales bacterium]
MSRILITGANGQLGNCLRDLAHSDSRHLFFYTDVDELDITNLEQVEDYVSKHDIEVIINAAGYTAVDKAETDAERCFLINRDATRNLALVTKRHDIFLVHISTDYVFDGASSVPYKPEDPINPQSVYGSSKAAGEAAIRETGCHAVVIRTSWLYSEYGGNFVKTMLRLGRERDEIRVVDDQFGGPTYAGDLAQFIMAVVSQRNFIEGMRIYHFANQGVISWNEFARQIMRNASLSCKVLPVSTAEYGAVAPRPAFSVFDLSAVNQDFGFEIPQWNDSLRKCMQKIDNQ